MNRLHALAAAGLIALTGCTDQPTPTNVAPAYVTFWMVTPAPPSDCARSLAVVVVPSTGVTDTEE